MIMQKKVIRYYFVIIGIFAIAFIGVGGNKKTNIVTSNVHNVKSVLSTRIVKADSETDKKSKTSKIITNLNDLKSYNFKEQLSFVGTLTGYGPDCEGCGGRVACSPNPDVRNGNIYYNDKEYGKIRILAADKAIPCGSIIHIENYKFGENNEVIGIVLDRGSAIVGRTMDLLYPSEANTKIIGRQRNIKFTIERWGWKNQK